MSTRLFKSRLYLLWMHSTSTRRLLYFLYIFRLGIMLGQNSPSNSLLRLRNIKCLIGNKAVELRELIYINELTKALLGVISKIPQSELVCIVVRLLYLHPLILSLMSLSTPLEPIIQNILFPHTNWMAGKNISRKTTPKVLTDNFATIKKFPHSRPKNSSLRIRY